MDIADLEQDIIKLARKHNLSKEKVKNIWNYQFKKTMSLIKASNEDGQDVKLRGLGTIKFLPYKLKKLKQNKHDREILFESSPKDGDRIEFN